MPPRLAGPSDPGLNRCPIETNILTVRVGAEPRHPEHTDGMHQTPVYYYSSTSNLTRRFAEHLTANDGRPVRDLADAEVRQSEADAPWVLLTPSYKAGNDDQVTLPAAVRAFLRSAVTRRNLVGIIGSGNRNFGRYYQAAARELAELSGRPILFEFELSGTPEDVTRCAEILGELDRALATG